ncbi:endoplasmic reticulum junction formation protein lunapark-A-like [Musca domestica]|uniref:Endoplasmic reticulum junction formation protein lunapark n=1 Tax=Musca domestica TaxID=7370 RepID=A0A1I8M1X2_MUSDO|nr:endoplasmic reticulum junction formation protein lunapark-A-like [Musca domestica]XP_058981079.1 endoplasmic reticulum junction formation protein lunapark-A-like [Musca domestica]XP_058981085.1 endoplasmic reticulum junction formation protein lunapark-A-like [Musca domestica]
MGIILAKFRKEKSTQEVLEELQGKIDELEDFTYNTQEQKKRIVGNFLAVSIGIYIIAFVVFYFVYFPPTWRDRIVYSIPLLLFPIIIIFLRHLFSWYYQRKLNKNSKKLTALRAEKKKILEQVMDKETYKVAVNLLARFADKPSRTTFSATTSSLRTPAKLPQTTSSLNRSLPVTAMKTTQLALTSPAAQKTSLGAGNTSTISNNSPRTATTTALSPLYDSTANQSGQLVRRRTPFPVVNQNEKGVFEKIVDVLIGDGPGDRFAMICKECYAHNGMALKEDFEYTTFRCAFCNALNPARKARPAAPRLTLNANTPQAGAANASHSSSDEKDDSDDDLLPVTATQFTTPLTSMTTRNANVDTSSSSEDEASQPKTVNKPLLATKPADGEEKQDEATNSDVKSEKLEKSDSAIDDVTMSPKE